MMEAEIAFLGDKVQEAARASYLAGVEAGKAGASGWYFAVGVLTGAVVFAFVYLLCTWRPK